MKLQGPKKRAELWFLKPAFCCLASRDRQGWLQNDWKEVHAVTVWWKSFCVKWSYSLVVHCIQWAGQCSATVHTLTSIVHLSVPTTYIYNLSGLTIFRQLSFCSYVLIRLLATSQKKKLQLRQWNNKFCFYTFYTYLLTFFFMYFLLFFPYSCASIKDADASEEPPNGDGPANGQRNQKSRSNTAAPCTWTCRFSSFPSLKNLPFHL